MNIASPTANILRSLLVSRSTAALATLEAAYLAKHPQAADLFQLGDFSIVAFTPLSARFVAGFGSAHTLTPEVLAAVIEDGIV